MCAEVTGDHEDAAAAVAASFDVSPIAASAILDLQVRRFTPRSVAQMRDELSAARQRLRDLGGA